jgi:hypothetical protein
MHEVQAVAEHADEGQWPGLHASARWIMLPLFEAAKIIRLIENTPTR